MSERPNSFSLPVITGGLLAAALIGCGVFKGSEGRSTNPASAPGSSTASACSTLQPGEHRIVDSRDIGTGLNARYKLIRTESGHEVVLNLMFLDPRGRLNVNTQARFAERAARCFEAASPYLLGPSGEKLVIRLPREGDPGPEAPAIAVQTTLSYTRGHSRLWPEHFECELILHEALHYTGLVDEYPEREQAGYECRIPGPVHSLLHTPRKALDAAVPFDPAGGLRLPEARAGKLERVRDGAPFLDERPSLGLSRGRGLDRAARSHGAVPQPARGGGVLLAPPGLGGALPPRGPGRGRARRAGGDASLSVVHPRGA